MLKPESEWREGMTPQKLIRELNQAVKFPGLTTAWTMPIKTRNDMLSTGIKTPVGIKVVGDDLETLQVLGREDRNGGARFAGYSECVCRARCGWQLSGF